MFPNQVFRLYEEFLPDKSVNTKEYFPNGKNSIRVRQNNGQEFIFTVDESNAWKLETLDQYIEDMRRNIT